MSKADEPRSCKACGHCEPRHQKPGVNTVGEYVCMVLGALVPDAIIDASMCSGLYFDERQEPNEPLEMDDMISAIEASELLGVSNIRVAQLCQNGQLRARKIGGAWIISRESAERRLKDPPAPWRPKRA